jgi:ribosomal protein S18 acetylase RimI-like enzyme
MTLAIRHADPTDAQRLADLALRTFHDTFAYQNSAEDMAAHIARSYSKELQLAQIQAPAIRSLVVEQDGDLIGYAQLRSGHTPDCVASTQAIELWRFYIDRAWVGQGIAQRLMQAVHDEALASNADTIWLGVWEHNARAIAFYRKCGFREVGAHDFHLGSDQQTDLIMVCEVIKILPERSQLVT